MDKKKRIRLQYLIKGDPVDGISLEEFTWYTHRFLDAEKALREKYSGIFELETYIVPTGSLSSPYLLNVNIKGEEGEVEIVLQEYLNRYGIPIPKRIKGDYGLAKKVLFNFRQGLKRDWQTFFNINGRKVVQEKIS